MSWASIILAAVSQVIGAVLAQLVEVLWRARLRVTRIRSAARSRLARVNGARRRRRAARRERRRPVPVHPSRARVHEALTLGDRLADKLTSVLGSWTFLRYQNLMIACWMGWNSVGPASARFDPPPFIGLNLFMSWQAANATPVIMMSQNRQAARDRVRDDTEAQEVSEMRDLSETELAILRGQDAVLGQQNEVLAQIAAQSAEIAALRALVGRVLAAHDPAPAPASPS